MLSSKKFAASFLSLRYFSLNKPFHISASAPETAIAWKVSKYGAFSGPNTEKYGPKKFRIWALFTQWVLHQWISLEISVMKELSFDCNFKHILYLVRCDVLFQIGTGFFIYHLEFWSEVMVSSCYWVKLIYCKSLQQRRY